MNLDKELFYLGDCPEALEFILLYHKYISAVDDLIDEPVSDLAEATLNVLSLHREVLTHRFWLAHLRELTLLDALIENAYRDSERLKATHPEAARMWSMYGELMVFAVLALAKGTDHLKKISTVVRSVNYESQVKDIEYARQTS